MLDRKERAHYKAFGLKLESEMKLPELQQSEDDPGKQSDVSIFISDFLPEWEEHAAKGERIVVEGNKIMFLVPGSATFVVQNGNSITVRPVENADPDKLRLYILGTCMGIILLQRSTLPLHGSAISINGKAYAIVGESGAGKSTLASALLQQGHELLSDDVIAITFSEKNVPMIVPSYPQQKLWEESILVLGMDIRDKRPLFERENKYAIPVTSRYCDISLPLAGVFELYKSNDGVLGRKEIVGIDCLPLLYRHTYRNFFIPRMGLMEWHFNTSVRLLDHIQLFQLRRPTSGFTVPQLIEAIYQSVDFNSSERATNIGNGK
ncbi:aldolase [Paenibacillus sp. TRM 82003]|nr:aldolase [Paenibacillus sp. TRM 82003]